MMRTILVIVSILPLTWIYSQDSTLVQIANWFEKNNFSIRRTFDGSKNENKPASLLFQENHKSQNDFLNVDFAVKISEIEIPVSTDGYFMFYPKMEWHKSTDSTSLKNKLGGGINFEFVPFLNKNLKGVVPWVQGASSWKRNLIDLVYETKLSTQLSLVGFKGILPGAEIRDKKSNFRMRYYPYLGFEYNNIPKLIAGSNKEEFSTWFFRLFVELWALPKEVQLLIDGTYRRMLKENVNIRNDLPYLLFSVNYYPLSQDSFSFGYEFQHGYDSESKFNLVKISSLKFNVKF